MPVPFIDFYGLKLSAINKIALFEEICTKISQNEKLVIFGYSLGSVRILKKYPIMYSFGWKHADVMMVDGRGLYLLGKALGFPFEDDVSIPELSKDILNLANNNRYKIFFLGTSQEINNKATDKIRLKYKNINMTGGIDGFFNIDQEEEVVRRINTAKPDILFVGISSPKKEEFVSRWKDKLDVKIILLCGGVIDIIAGDKKQTPRWLKKIGGAGLFRFVQEPVRLYNYFFPFIFFLCFQFLPVLLYKVIIMNDKEFSLPRYYKIDKYL